MPQKGRKLWQENSYREAHELLQKTLVQAIDGITKNQIHEKTRLSRSTIDRHLRDFMIQHEVMRERRLFFWSINYKLTLERYRLVFDIIDLLEKAEAVFRTKIAIAHDTLKGDALNKRLDEVYLEELGWRAQVLREQKERGVTGAEDKEAMVKDLLREFERAPPEKRLEILKKQWARMNRDPSEEE